MSDNDDKKPEEPARKMSQAETMARIDARARMEGTPNEQKKSEEGSGCLGVIVKVIIVLLVLVGLAFGSCLLMFMK